MGKKILFFSDMHGDRRAVDVAHTVIKKEKPDLVVYLGDFSKRVGDKKQNVDDAAYLLGKLSEHSEVKALFGNCDEPDLVDFLESEGASLHNKLYNIGKTIIIGYGGSSPTPFHTPSEFGENEIKESLENLIREAERFEPEILILATHTPPKNTKTDVIPGSNAGSNALRAIIEEHQPTLNICGHIHESKGSDFVGRTKVVNVGPANEGNFLMVEIDGDVYTRELKI
jgi:uncharacterized protein